jgi:hypothetical protein
LKALRARTEVSEVETSALYCRLILASLTTHKPILQNLYTYIYNFIGLFLWKIQIQLISTITFWYYLEGSGNFFFWMSCYDILHSQVLSAVEKATDLMVITFMMVFSEHPFLY